MDTVHHVDEMGCAAKKGLLDVDVVVVLAEKRDMNVQEMLV